jgi:small subunit ribosomal protein S17
MSSLWNFTNPLRTGCFRLQKSGRELYGTVVKAGVNQKTVTVRVNRFFYVQKLHKTFSRMNEFQVHDEEEFCRIGDKVVIQSCRPMSRTKKYFVRNVVVMGGRPWQGEELAPEKRKLEEAKSEK